MTKKDYKLGYEIDALTRAIEQEENEEKRTEYKNRLGKCEQEAEKIFGSVEQCLLECL